MTTADRYYEKMTQTGDIAVAEIKDCAVPVVDAAVYLLYNWKVLAPNEP